MAKMADMVKVAELAKTNTNFRMAQLATWPKWPK